MVICLGKKRHPKVLSGLGERSSSVRMASRKGLPCQGWSLPENPGSLLGWGLAAASWLLDKVSELSSPQGNVHKGHCRGKMPVRKTDGLFSFLLGFSETSTFTPHLSFLLTLFSRVSLAGWTVVWTELSGMPTTAWGVYPQLEVVGAVHSCPDKAGFGPGTGSLLKKSVVGVGPAAAWGSGESEGVA